MGLHVLGCRVDVLRPKEEVVPKAGLLPYVPEWKLGMSDVFPPVWNLRAAISFHFSISSLILLPGPVAFSVLSFFC